MSGSRSFSRTTATTQPRKRKHRELASHSHSSSISSANSNYKAYESKKGDVINDRYEVFNQLGKGTFGGVLACIDHGPDDQNDFRKDVVSIKVIRAVKRYVKSAREEANILDLVTKKFASFVENNADSEEAVQLKEELKTRKCSWCVSLITSFDWKDHYCIVTEALGLSVFDVIKANKYHGFCLKYTLTILQQLFEALMFLKNELSLVHTDLKLENILFVTDTSIVNILSEATDKKSYKRIVNSVALSDLTIKLIDFGGARFIKSGSNKSRSRKHHYSIINTRQYRSPEVTIESGWSFPSDIWSAACIAYEIFSGDLLFPTHSEREHLALIEKVTGASFYDEPELMRKSYRGKHFFDRDGLYWPGRSTSSKSIKFVKRYKNLKRLVNKVDEEQDVTKFLEILYDALEINPSRRLNAELGVKRTKEALINQV